MSSILEIGDNPIVPIVVVGVILVVVVAFRLYALRNPGIMRAKCPKCGSVFDASRMFSGIHLGPFKQLTCPACGKTSFMNAYSKAPLSYPPQTKQEPASEISEEELEQKRIENSKYERA
jgi:ribosomal protein S27AE